MAKIENLVQREKHTAIKWDGTQDALVDVIKSVRGHRIQTTITSDGDVITLHVYYNGFLAKIDVNDHIVLDESGRVVDILKQEDFDLKYMQMDAPKDNVSLNYNTYPTYDAWGQPLGTQ